MGVEGGGVGYPTGLAINEKSHIEPFRWLSGVYLKTERSNKSLGELPAPQCKWQLDQQHLF